MIWHLFVSTHARCPPLALASIWVAQPQWPLPGAPLPASPCVFHHAGVGRLSRPSSAGRPQPAPCGAARALADPNTGLLLPWSAVASGARTVGSPQPGKTERSIPTVPTQQLLLGAAGVTFFAAGWITADLKGTDYKQYLGNSKSCWLFHVSHLPHHTALGWGF